MDHTQLLVIIKNTGFILIMLYLSSKDLKNNMIPNHGIAAALLLWAAFQILTRQPGYKYFYSFIAGMLIAGTVLFLSRMLAGIMHTDDFGMGDIKLIFAISLYLGFWRSLYMLFVALALGAGAYLIFYRKSDNGSGIFPFGPFLAASACLFLN